MKTVSINQIVSRVYDNIGNDQELQVDILYQWIGECLKKINFPLNLSVHKITLEVNNYKALFPCDMYDYIHFEVNGVRLMLNNSVDSSYVDCKLLYKPNGMYVDFNFECGNVDMFYYKMLVDDNGLPLIPDEEYLKEALFWYIESKLAYRMWRTAARIESNHKAGFYTHAKDQFERYATFAKAKYKAPDIDRMQNFTHQWNSLIRRSKDYYTSFGSSNSKEHLKYGNELFNGVSTNAPKNISST